MKPRHIKGGRVDPKTLPQGPNGRALCRQCSIEVSGRRKTFCSNECVENWIVRTGSGMARLVRKRDKGICAICKLDCAALQRQCKKLPRAEQKAFKERYGVHKGRKRFWDVDHIIPVVEGGGLASLEGLRTLCIECHKSVTKQLAAKRAKERRNENIISSTNKTA